MKNKKENKRLDWLMKMQSKMVKGSRTYRWFEIKIIKAQGGHNGVWPYKQRVNPLPLPA